MKHFLRLGFFYWQLHPSSLFLVSVLVNFEGPTDCCLAKLSWLAPLAQEYSQAPTGVAFTPPALPSQSLNWWDGGG